MSRNILRDGDQLMLPWWDGGECVCDSEGKCVPKFPSLETSLPPRLMNVNGTCGRRASADGDNQRIISFSLYGDDPGYWSQLSDSLSKIKKLYPGWKVWLYTEPRGKSGYLCPLLKKHSHLRVCDVSNLPNPLFNITQVLPTMWRIVPLGDPTVDVLLVRDTDMMFSEREQTAVMDWLSSGKTFHVMRDHPNHVVQVLAGMWGARWDVQEEKNSTSATVTGPRRADLINIRNKMLKLAYLIDQKMLDQEIMKRVLWPEMVGFMVSHDSFYCQVFKSGWKPWPMQRKNGDFVGNAWYRKEFANNKMKVMCPAACRPPDHQDWQYC
ncbi:hypothetical protein SK128_006725 [Halocaridina rubra]|uniref:Uncharacterized protein n=1 Tax=Halocaridina rubra TaxID=373956 RepID=A0AAN9ACU3_HALRR